MKELLEQTIKASIDAGKRILEIYEKDFSIETKSDESPLTEADTAANEVINSYLNKTGIPIISEENKQLDYSERKKWDKCWIVDPLDGTKEFIKRNGEFTVNIALVENGKPLFGVIYVPVTKELYIGDVNECNAWKVVVEDDSNIIKQLTKENEIKPSSNKNKDIIRVVGSRSHMNEDTVKFIEELKQEYEEVEIVSKGSSLKFCLVAEGKADVYPRFAPTMEWDTAAGQAICEAVGVKVVDQTTRESMVYNRKNLLNNYFLVR
jgi:3'(2'), 5'-bisphosphate nucleotidase